LNSSSAVTPTIDRSQVKRTKYIATADTAPSAVYEKGGRADPAQQPPELAANDSPITAGSSSDAAVDIMDLPPVKRVARAQ
jgi:hypothetical protein